MQEEDFMRLALDQARQGRTSPNPRVGAVIVQEGTLLSAGYHRGAGLPHAEIEALRALPDPALARGATLYVTLEPCSTQGRTPPCVDAILKAGLRRVVVGTIDPNPAHAGRGLELLRAAGVEVSCGVLEPECRALNPEFNHWIVHRTPWVLAKAGLSLDGRITRPPGEGQWLTSEASRTDAMQLRDRVDAILIGANTLRADNPRLTLRNPDGSPSNRQPWRVVLAGSQPLPPDAHLFTDAFRDKTLVFTQRALPEVLRQLGERQITSVLIEGGSRVLGEAFDQRLVHEVCFYLAPLLCGGPDPAVGGLGVASTPSAPILRNPDYRRIGDDLRCSGTVEYPAESFAAPSGPAS